MGNNEYHEIFNYNGRGQKRSFSKMTFGIKDVIAILTFVGVAISMYTAQEVNKSKVNDRLSHVEVAQEKADKKNEEQTKEFSKQLNEIKEITIEIRTKINERENNSRSFKNR